MKFLRRLVSGQKKRFQDGPDGFDLDLAYITPRVIAMGLPAQGKEVLYRNPMQEIARFLQTYHRGHAKVYNLCSEHTYSPQQLSVALQQYPWDDHQTPPLAIVQQFCADAAAWLATDPANVVVVHCKAGKGRTGIMICCLLLYLHKNAPDLANLANPPAASSDSAWAAGSRLASPWIPAMAPAAAAAAAAAQPAADVTAVMGPAAPSCHAGVAGAGSGLCDAGRPQRCSSGWHPWHFVPPVELRQLEQPVRDILDMYAERRTHDGNGVTIKSQRRYVGYFWVVLCSGPGPVGVLPKPRAVQLRQVVIRGLAHGTADSCVLLVEARPSGSLAPRASRVCARVAPRAVSGGVAGLCMVPCAHAPLADDDTCTISSDPSGDTITFRMPAASMGLSLMQQHSSSSNSGIVPGAAPVVIAAAGSSPITDTQVSSVHGCCLLCGGSSGNACNCSAAAACVLPGAVPEAAQLAAEASGTPAAATRPLRAAVTADALGDGLSAADEVWDASDQVGCCVVEGDVRLVVMRGTTRLFYTWFNTAFLPLDGCYTLTRAQLDKPSKSLPADVSLTVRFVDMQPTAEAEEAAGAAAAEQPGQPNQQQPHQPWPFGFQEPPLETSTKPGKGAAQQQGKALLSQQGKTINMTAEAAGGFHQHGAMANFAAAVGLLLSSGGAVQQQRLARSSSASAVEASSLEQASATCAVHLVAADTAVAQQQQQHLRVSDVTGPAALTASSISAPASPQGSKLRSSGSWRQHFPVISSISGSSLLWGPAAGTTGRPSSAGSRLDSPSSWCGSAGYSWDWDSLAAADDGDAGLAADGVRPAPTPLFEPAAAGAGAGGAASAGSWKQQQQQQRRSFSLQGRQRHCHSRSNSCGSGGAGGRDCVGISQDLHSSCLASSPATRGNLAVVTGLRRSQASIELPVIVKRASGVDSLVEALLDPETHTASSGHTAAAAAAAEAAGRVLASEASSAAVASRSTAGYTPPSQLRKGYSWHGSSSWFTSMAAASSAAAAADGSTRIQQAEHGRARHPSKGQQQVVAGGSRPASQKCTHFASLPGATDTAALTADLDPLLLTECSGDVPGSLLSSCDPLQGLLEALNWSTDMRRYQTLATDSSSGSRTQGHPGRRRSTSSEPCSPRRGSMLLPTVLSSPQLQPCKSAPVTPPQSAVEQQSRAAQGAASLRGPAAVVEQSWGSSGMQRAPRATGRGMDSSSRRARPVRPDVCRLLDLEDWAEDETEGLDVADAAAAHNPGPAQHAVHLKAGGPSKVEESDAAAAADVSAVSPTAARATAGLVKASTRGKQSSSSPGFTGNAGGSSSLSRVGATSSARSARRQAAVRDDALQGLLASEGALPSSCAAEAPAVLQQWQQLEKAWHRSWWV